MTLPRVALLGTMANNLYNACCNLRQVGVEATFFLDGDDTFAMGQPVWEESPLRLSTQELYGLTRSMQEWLELTIPTIPDDGRLCVLRQRADGSVIHGVESDNERRYAFRGSMKDGLSDDDILRRAQELGSELDPELRKEILRLARQRLHLIRALSTFDVLIASLYHESLWACLTGKPVYYELYGGDVVHVLDNKHDKYPLDSRIFRHVLRQKNMVYGPLLREDIRRICAKHDLLGHAVPSSESRVNLPKAALPPCHSAARRALGIAQDTFLIFLPSRIDRTLKGTDAFLRAFCTFAAECPEAILLTAGWGNDLGDLTTSFAHPQIRFLDHVMSKPLLFDHMTAADLVVDQFALGAIGSTGREALALGRPLLAFVSAHYQLCWEQPLPMLHAATEEGMVRHLRWLHHNRHEGEALGALGRQWLHACMSPHAVAEELRQLHALGAEQTLACATPCRQGILEKDIVHPAAEASVRLLRWPWPYKAGMSLSHEGRGRSWKELCALHIFMSHAGRPTAWGEGVGLPFSDGLYMYGGPEDAAWFGPDGLRPSACAPLLAALVQGGILDALRAWGRFDPARPFARNHAALAAEHLSALAQCPDIFLNEDSVPAVQNVGGRFAGTYERGDVPEAAQYHTDILRHLGVRWIWCDAGHTRQFGLMADALPADDLTMPDTFPWKGQLFYRDRLRDGWHVRAFRRWHNETVGDQPALRRLLSPRYLDHLERSGGGACVRWHMQPSLAAPLASLARRYHDRSIWVAPLGVFLRHVYATQQAVPELSVQGEALRLRVWFQSQDMENETDMAGLSLIVRAALPVTHVEYENRAGQWLTAHPEVRRLEDGSQLVRWPLPAQEAFPFSGHEYTP